MFKQKLENKKLYWLILADILLEHDTKLLTVLTSYPFYIQNQETDKEPQTRRSHLRLGRFLYRPYLIYYFSGSVYKEM